MADYNINVTATAPDVANLRSVISEYAGLSQAATDAAALALAAADRAEQAAGGDRVAMAVLIATTDFVPVAGVTYHLDGLQYLGQTGATDIADLPGLVPADDVTLWHFGALGTSTSGTTGSSADDTVAFQAAADYAASVGRDVIVPSLAVGKAFRLTSLINIPIPVRFVGGGAVVDISVNPAQPGGGAWIYLDHLGHGLYFRDDAAVGYYDYGGAVVGIGFDRNQATPAASWTPTAHTADIRVEGRVDLDDVIHLKSTKAVLVRSAGCLTTIKHRGQVFVSGVEVDRSADVQRHDGTHWWPYWSQSADVLGYSIDNGAGWLVKRADGLKLDNPFIYGLGWLLDHADDAAAGSGLGELTISGGYADKAGGAVRIVTNNYQCRASIDVCVNSDSAAGGAGDGVQVAGSVASVIDLDLTVTRAHGAAVSATGAAHKVSVRPGVVKDWDRLATGRAAFVADTGATIALLNTPQFSASPVAQYDQGASGIITLPIAAQRGRAAVVPDGLFGRRVAIADDAVAVVAMPAANLTAQLYIIPASPPSNGSPSADFWGRGTGSPACTVLRTSHATGLATTNTVLNGTTGTDGNLTIGCAGGNFYIENRTGSSKTFTYLVVGS